MFNLRRKLALTAGGLVGLPAVPKAGYRLVVAGHAADAEESESG